MATAQEMSDEVIDVIQDNFSKAETWTDNAAASLNALALSVETTMDLSSIAYAFGTSLSTELTEYSAPTAPTDLSFSTPTFTEITYSEEPDLSGVVDPDASSVPSALDPVDAPDDLLPSDVPNSVSSISASDVDGRDTGDTSGITVVELGTPPSSSGAYTAITPFTPITVSSPPDPSVSEVGSITSVSLGTDPTIGQMEALSGVDTGVAPDSQIDLGGTPSAFAATSFTLPAELAALTLPDFSSIIPADTVAELTAAYLYLEPTYEAQVKTELKDVLQTVLSGTRIVSEDVWDSIWTRATAKAARIQVAEEWAASNLAASLGMTGMVSETLLVRLDAAEQKSLDRASEVTLERAIQEALQRREDWWNGVREGIAFENMWIQQHEGIAGRALATAAKSHEALVAVHQSNIARLNALLNKAGQEVAVGRLDLEKALVPLQEQNMKIARMDQQLRRNDQLLREWLGEWQGWQTDKGTNISLLGEQIRAYLSEWQGDKARHDGDVAKRRLVLDTEIAESRDVYSAKVQAAKIKHDASVAYEALKLDKERVDVSAYSAVEGVKKALNDVDTAIAGLDINQQGANTEAYNSQIGGKRNVFDSEIAKQTLKQQIGDSDIRGFLAKWEAIRTIGQYLGAVLGAKGGIFGTEAQQAAAVHRSQIESKGLENTVYRERIDRFAKEWDVLLRRVAEDNSRFDSVTQRHAQELGKFNGEVSRYNVTMQGENIKQTWNRTLVQKGTAIGQGNLAADLGVAQFQVTHEFNGLAKLADLNVGVAQGFLQGSDVALGARVGYSSGESLSFGYSGKCSNQPACPTAI